LFAEKPAMHMIVCPRSLIGFRSTPAGPGAQIVDAGGQKYEVTYEAKKTGRSAASVKKAVK
jgi:hypothetical protein